MAIRGIEPSYFAGMPTVQRDPRAGQPNAEYMQMPGQALSEVANRNERRREVDQNNAFRAREQGHRESQDRLSANREDRRLAMYQQGEDRRQTQQSFENDRLKSSDTMKLVQALRSALRDKEMGIAAAIAGELEKRGIPVKGLTAQDVQSEAPTQPGSHVAPEAGGPEIGSQDMSWAESGAPDTGASLATRSLAGRLRGALSESPATGAAVRGALGGRPMSNADSQTSTELDQAEQTMITQLRGTGPTAPSTSPAVSTPSPRHDPARPNAQDAALSNQLDQVEAQYMAGLGQRPLVPGGYRSPLRSRAIKSDQLLSADDPLNRIVQ